MEKRSYFKKIFGTKKQVEQGYQKFDFINNSSSTFNQWDGNLFDNDIVRACIRPKVNAISKLNAKHNRGYGSLMQVNPDSYIRQILQKPNPYMSMQDFLMKMVWQRELNHNAFAFVKRDSQGYPFEIYPIPATSVELLEKNDDVFAKFRFRNGDYIVVPYSDLIHLKKDYNSNDFFGEGGTRALEPIMNVITTTDQGIVSAIKNSATIKWVLKFKTILNPKDKQKEVDEFVKNYLNIANSSGAAAIDTKFDIEQVKQESYVPNSELVVGAVQRLYSYFGVNEAIVQNKYSEGEWLSFYESELEPIIIQLSDAFTNVFFTQRERGFGNRIIFEGSNLVFGSFQSKMALVSMVDRGAMTPNEWRAVLNLTPLEGGDEPIRRLDTATVVKKEDSTESEESK